MIRFVVHLDGQSGNRGLVVQRQPAVAPLLQTCWDCAIKFRAVWKQISSHYPCLGPLYLAPELASSLSGCHLSIEPGV